MMSGTTRVYRGESSAPYLDMEWRLPWSGVCCLLLGAKLRGETRTN
jgi:hypothetical protein